MTTTRNLILGLGFVKMADGFRFLRKPENPYQREDKMFFEPCTPEKKCIQSLIEFTQDPGSCNSPIGRQMNELNWIQRTHLFFSCQNGS